MFSPHYAAARRRGAANPREHCALNVALYGRGKHWALTERPRAALEQSETTLRIGPSALQWKDGALTVDIDERAVPRFTRLRGRIRLFPRALTSCVNVLDEAGGHHWWPIAPQARVEVEMQNPSLRWSGSGYLDSNWGARALEEDFTDWTWSRAETKDGALTLYDAQRRHGDAVSLAYRFGGDGSVQTFAPPPVADLPRTGWRMPRPTRSEGGARAIRTLEDTPFYARSVIETQLLGARVQAVHESLSLARFKTRWVQTLLPFRAPRARR